MIRVSHSIVIEDREIELEFVRSSGPGGQNVNKVATAVQLRFDALGSPSLPQRVKDRLPRIAGRRMTSDGVVLIDARRYRTQERNRQDAVDRLVKLIRRASERQKPRRATKPTRASRERRLSEKKRRGKIKRDRGKRPSTDD